MWKLYHFGFDFDSKRAFCSKLVYEAYLEALGVEVGTLETFQELFNKNPTAPANFWRIWFLGSIPWHQRTVTTTSQLQSHSWNTIASAGV